MKGLPGNLFAKRQDDLNRKQVLSNQGDIFSGLEVDKKKRAFDSSPTKPTQKKQMKLYWYVFNKIIC